jgi:hypothetical protein
MERTAKRMIITTVPALLFAYIMPLVTFSTLPSDMTRIRWFACGSSVFWLGIWALWIMETKDKS